MSRTVPLEHGARKTGRLQIGTADVAHCLPARKDDSRDGMAAINTADELHSPLSVVEEGCGQK